MEINPWLLYQLKLAVRQKVWRLCARYFVLGFIAGGLLAVLARG